MVIDGLLGSPISALLGINLLRSRYVIKTISILKCLFCEIVKCTVDTYLIGRYETSINRYSILLFGRPALHVYTVVRSYVQS